MEKQRLTPEILSILMRNGLVEKVQIIETFGQWFISVIHRDYHIDNVLHTNNNIRIFKKIDTAINYLRKFNFDGIIQVFLTESSTSESNLT